VDVPPPAAWGVWGFVINSVTGMMFFAGAAGQTSRPRVHLKVLCILLAGANVLYLTLFDEVWRSARATTRRRPRSSSPAHRCFCGSA